MSIEAIRPGPIAGFLLLVLQLALVTYLIHEFQIENAVFGEIAVLVLAGFVVHSFLPHRYRLPFLLLSLTSIFMVFGALNGAILTGLALALIAICHLPTALSVRVAILLVVGTALAVARLGWVDAHISRAIWPILGSMFMFRLVVYLYDRQHEKDFSLSRTFAYFFMLPNVCFPMFPVVDYKTFKRTYYNNPDINHTYQVGIRWMIRGVVQLILYRFVYYYLAISPADVTNIADLSRFLIANYLLYLRISGQFHLVVGILHLFGFNLPETHHLYLFASSITDFWRRINIYWKDFMMKLFYYPSVFWLRRRGWKDNAAMVVATLFVFISTWLLHSYQWFWLRGAFPLTIQDGLFWGILGVLVVASTLYESKYGRTRSVAGQSRSLGKLAGLALSATITFGFICILWSLWTAESLTQWASMWSSARPTTFALNSLDTLGVILAVLVVGTAATSPAHPGSAGKRARRLLPGMWSIVYTIGLLLVLCAIGHPLVYSRLDSRVGHVIRSLTESRLNAQDATRLEAGYYENLLSVERFNSQLWELYSRQPANWGNLRESGGMRPTSTFLVEELIPSTQILFKGTTFRTNQWGMRDREYDHAKTAGTYRIALLGPSDTMGSGVEEEETFASVLERRFNMEFGGPERRFEVLNFASANYTPLQHLWLLEHRVLPFQPDALILVGHDDDISRSARHLGTVVHNGVDVPYDFLRQVVRQADVRRETSDVQMRRQLRPHAEAITRWAYQTIADECRESGIVPVWLFLPFLVEETTEADPKLIEMANEASFSIVDLWDLYKGADISRYRIADWDQHHPNPVGHRMIADRLFEVLRHEYDRSRLDRSTTDISLLNNETRSPDGSTAREGGR